MTASAREQLARDAADLLARRNRPVERFVAEVEFAEGLARLFPSRRKAWARLVEEACRIVTRAIAAGRADDLEKPVARAEKVLAPLGKVAKTYTVHCAGHAHIDMNWMWSWSETVGMTNDTFTTVLKLMDEFPTFCFTQSQASVYALLKEYNPDLLARIAERVKEGRWEVAAVNWVEADKNLPAGEGLARHMLYTRRFMKETFDLAPEDVPIDWMPDSFGHAHTIPTIAARGGVTRYYLCRGGGFEKPPVFWWQGPDGSRILVNLETVWYNGEIDARCATALLQFCEKTGLKDWMRVYGVGDHGGGPTRRDVLRALDMDAWPVYPHFRLATTREFYAILEKHGDRWPVLDRELNYEFTGCYTSQSRVKQAVRLGETNCLEAESVAALVWRTLGRPYPGQMLRDAWIGTLFGHFHDILPGSGARWTREYQSALIQNTNAATSLIKTEALRALAAAVDTDFAASEARPAPSPSLESPAMGAGVGIGTMLGGVSAAAHVSDGPRAFLVANPTAWARQEVVRVSVWDVETGAPGAPQKQFIARGPDGRAVPAQRIRAGDGWGHRFVELAFPVAVGPLGYAAYVVEEGTVEGHEAAVRCTTGFRGGELHPEGPFSLENEHLSVLFDRTTGGVVRFLDKRSGRDLASPEAPIALVEYVLERPRGMSAWIIGDVLERRCPLGLESLQAQETGPHVASIVAKARLNDSTLAVTYALAAGQPWLDIKVEAMWLERGSATKGTPALRMQFPLPIRDARARYEIPFGSIERDLAGGEEVPALRWADVTGTALRGGGKAGCALLNTSTYGHSLTGSTLRVSLVRSSHDPDPLPEMGEYATRLALVPHGQAPAAADLVRLGAGLNQPLLVVATDVHKGRLPRAAAAATVSPAGVVLTSLKRAEDADALVFRLQETAGRPAQAKVTLDRRLLGRPEQVVEVDFLERPLEKSTARAAKDAFTVTVPGYGIASVRVHLAR